VRNAARRHCNSSHVLRHMCKEVTCVSSVHGFGCPTLPPPQPACRNIDLAQLPLSDSANHDHAISLTQRVLYKKSFSHNRMHIHSPLVCHCWAASYYNGVRSHYIPRLLCTPLCHVSSIYLPAEYIVVNQHDVFITFRVPYADPRMDLRVFHSPAIHYANNLHSTECTFKPHCFHINHFTV